MTPHSTAKSRISRARLELHVAGLVDIKNEAAWRSIVERTAHSGSRNDPLTASALERSVIVQASRQNES